MNLTKSLLCCSFMPIIIYSVSVSAKTNPAPIMPTWSKSIVKIWVKCDKYDEKEKKIKLYSNTSATGTIISKDGYILSAGHVGRDCGDGNDPNISNIEISIGILSSPYISPEKQFKANFIERTVENDSYGNKNRYDLSLFKIINTAKVFSPIKISKTLPFPGDNISVIGFSDLPVADFNEYYKDKYLQSNISIYKTNILNIAAGNNVPFRLNYGGNSLPGMSGGPVLDKNGNLIGVHSERKTKSINNLINNRCDTKTVIKDGKEQFQEDCYGNAINIDYIDNNNNKQSKLNIDYNKLKDVLDNFSWATSISSINELKKIKELGLNKLFE